MTEFNEAIGPHPSGQYDGIIPTGWLTAYGRAFSDIPYAQPVFDELEARRTASGPSATLEAMKNAELAPRFEARHKLLNNLIARTSISQVLEVAAGLSTRGLEMTADEGVQYVEIDLPDMMDDKRKIFSDLEHAGTIPGRSNLHIEDGSAVDWDDLQNAVQHFNPDQPIAVVNEGLLRYLTLAEKTIYAKNVKSLLDKFGGVWIMSDSLPNATHQDDDATAEFRERVSGITGVNVGDNLFENDEDGKQFFENLGFEVESYSFKEVIDELTSPAKLKIPREYVETLSASAVCYVMRTKDQNE